MVFCCCCRDKLWAGGREPELLFVKDKWKSRRGGGTFTHGKKPLPKPPPSVQLKKNSPPHFILHVGIAPSSLSPFSVHFSDLHPSPSAIKAVWAVHRPL